MGLSHKTLPRSAKANVRASAAGAKGTAGPSPKRPLKRMPSRSAKLRATFNTILADLLGEIDASRTTLRLDDAALGFSVADVAGEAHLPTEKSLRGQTSINQRAAATAQWIEQHRHLLVQNDFSVRALRPPEALLQLYGVKAQMLAPVIREGRLDGWVSVHETRRMRKWSKKDQAAIVAAAEQILEALEGDSPDYPSAKKTGTDLD
jgi:maleate isomerase